MSLNDSGICNIFNDLAPEGSIFQRVDAPAVKAVVPVLVVTLGTKSKLNRFSYRNECKYDGCLQERAW